MPVFTEHIMLYFSRRNVKHFEYKAAVAEELQPFANRSLTCVDVCNRFVTVS
jgi:hypothetical protein